MTRFRAIFLLIAASLLCGAGLHMTWFSDSGVSEVGQSSTSVDLIGASVVPQGRALMVALLVVAGSLLVLPWWLRISAAVLAIVIAGSVALVMTRTLLAGEIGATGQSRTLGDVAVLGPLLVYLSVIVASVVLVGVLGSSRHWPGLSSRYIRKEPTDMWGQLDRGIDPTDH